MAERDLPNEVLALMDELSKFSRVARVPNTDGVVCGDGGVLDQLKTTNGKIVDVAGHAGDLGQDIATITAIMAFYDEHLITYDAEVLTRDVVDAYVSCHGKFEFHTSNHTHGGKITDCGDMHGKMSAAEYGLNTEKVAEVIKTAQKMAREEQLDCIEEQTLGDRNHEERGVIIVEGETHTLTHWIQDGDGSGMWFVLDPDRAQIRRRLALEQMGFESDQISEIMNIKAQHDVVTNSRLAKGKHVFGVNVDLDEPVIRYIGQVNVDGSIN